MPTTRLTTPPLAALLAGALAACNDDAPSERTITHERRWLVVGAQAEAGVPAADRFGFTGAASPHDHAAEAPVDRDGSPAGGLTWTTPPGWQELPPSSTMRAASFTVAGDERAECSLTLLAGDGGGLLANVNRWRAQMSFDPITEEALAELPRETLLGAEAVLVDLEGEYAGMGGGPGEEDYRLVGLIAVHERPARFLKMTGPAEVIDSELDAFLELAASFEPARGAPAADREAGGSGLTWTAPASWRRAGERPMRAATYVLGDGGECYVALLGGDGGGAFANVNRWRGQMGATELSRAEFEALERIPMLGTEAVVVEAVGTYRGMGDELVEGATLLGAVCELPDRAVFVKLVGPQPVVAAARADFLAFCKSMERVE